MTAFFASLATCFVFFHAWLVIPSWAFSVCFWKNWRVSSFSLYSSHGSNRAFQDDWFRLLHPLFSAKCSRDLANQVLLVISQIQVPSIPVSFLGERGTALNYLKGWNTRKEIIITTNKILRRRSRCNCRVRWLNSLLAIISGMELKTNTVYPSGVATWKDQSKELSLNDILLF